MARRRLIIFDHVPAGLVSGETDLFALTSDARVLEAVRRATDGTVLKSARLLDEAVCSMRDGLAAWSAGLGRAQIGGRSVIEHLLLPAAGMSAWWLGLLSEKNNMKTDVFFQLARLNAVERLLASGRYDAVSVHVCDGALSAAFSAAARRLGLASTVRSGTPAAAAPREKLKRLVRAMGAAGDVALATARFSIFIARRLKARSLPPLARRRPAGPTDILVSYFPAQDAASAREGRHANKYLDPLGDLSVGRGRTPAWLYIPVAADGWTFEASLSALRRFIESGRLVYFIEEFLTPAAVAAVLRDWVHLLLAWLRLDARMDAGFYAGGLFTPEARFLLRPVMRRSVIGWTAVEGLLFHALFEEVFTFFRGARRCVYVSEMDAWEKALNAAKERRAPHVRAVAFQHTAVSENYFFYFPDPAETARSGRPDALPLPDVTAANGGVPFELMARSAYPGLRQVEALRHLSMAASVAAPAVAKSSPPVVVVAGSISAEESRGLILFVRDAFSGLKGMRVLFKSHPTLSAAQLFSEVGVDPASVGFEITTTPMSELLATATAVVVGGSSVAIEALAHGCMVLTPVVPDSMLMMPLGGHDNLYQKTYNTKQLRDAVEEIIRRGPDPQRVAQGRRFIGAYWNLDPKLPQWRAVLD